LLWCLNGIAGENSCRPHASLALMPLSAKTHACGTTHAACACMCRSKVHIHKAAGDFYAAVIDDKIVVKIGEHRACPPRLRSARPIMRSGLKDERCCWPGAVGSSTSAPVLRVAPCMRECPQTQQEMQLCFAVAVLCCEGWAGL